MRNEKEETLYLGFSSFKIKQSSLLLQISYFQTSAFRTNMPKSILSNIDGLVNNTYLMYRKHTYKLKLSILSNEYYLINFQILFDVR